MALNTYRFADRFAVTTEAGIKIHPRRARMLTSRGQIGPACTGVIPGDNKFALMTFYAKLEFFVTGETVVLVTARRQGMIVAKIERVSLLIQIVALVAFEALQFRVAHLARFTTGLA